MSFGRQGLEFEFLYLPIGSHLLDADYFMQMTYTVVSLIESEKDEDSEGRVYCVAVCSVLLCA